MLAGNSTMLEARVFSSPSDSALVQWYHKGRLIDTANEARYVASSDGDIRRLEVNRVSENELGEYMIVVSLNGLNATDRITLNFPGMYTISL